MISTLKALFQGRRELFRGLKIEQKDWEKEVYPVLHLDMSKASSANIPGFEEKLSILMEVLCSAQDVAYDPKKTAFAKIPHEWLDKDEKAVDIVEFNYDPAARTFGEVRTEPA